MDTEVWTVRNILQQLTNLGAPSMYIVYHTVSIAWGM